MRQWIRSHLTYANVAATLALVIAIGGGSAYAANTVFSSDIVDNQVYSADVRNDTLAGGGLAAADLRPASVGTSEVRNDSVPGGGLTAADLGEDSVGSQEFQYGVLQSHARTWQDSTPTNTVTPKELTVSCPLAAQGEEVTGGGYVISNAGVNVPSVVVQRSYAVDQHTWLVRAVATSGTPTWGLTVVANCIQ